MIKMILEMRFRAKVFFILLMFFVPVANSAHLYNRHLNQLPINLSSAEQSILSEQSISYFKSGKSFYKVISRIAVWNNLWKGDFYQLLKINPRILNHNRYCFNDFYMNKFNSKDDGDHVLYFHKTHNLKEKRPYYEGPKPTVRPFPFSKYMDYAKMIYNVAPQQLHELLPSKKLELCSREE